MPGLVKVAGYRWWSSKGKNACSRCAALHGKEFYFKPKAGQLAVAGMEEPPLHYNCRCKLIEIIDTSQAVQEQEITPAERRENPHLTKGASKFGGGYWKNDGRSPTDGPARGNYCGQRWFRGRNPENLKPGEPYPPEVPPVDSMDEQCMRHDYGYDEAEKAVNPIKARLREDQLLVDRVAALGDPSEWENPPANIEDARTYRKLLLVWFEWKIMYFEMEDKYGSEFMRITNPPLYYLFHEEDDK